MSVTKFTPEQRAEFDRQREAMEEWFAPEELDPILEYFRYRNHLGWTVIKHPLVVSIGHADPMNKMMNTQLHEKRKAVRQARNEGNWDLYVWLHQRAWRVHAFQRIARHMTDAAYWELLGDIWVDSENIRENPKKWDRLLRSERGDRHAIMDRDEQRQFSELPDEVTIYQGHTVERHDGWSWTLQKSVAEWFATRFADLESSSPVLSTGKIGRENILAYFSRRNEEEVLVDRDLVKNLKVRA
jgi:hypothetical protein